MRSILSMGHRQTMQNETVTWRNAASDLWVLVLFGMLENPFSQVSHMYGLMLFGMLVECKILIACEPFPKRFTRI